MMIEKAEESLKAAQFCLDRGLYNSATSRAYYAMYQAVEVALNDAGFHRGEWSHPGLQATLSNELIKRRKLYPSVFSRYINRALELRIIGKSRSAKDRAPKRHDGLKRSSSK